MELYLVKGVGLPKSDILFRVGPSKSDMIGNGWVGWSKKGPKNRISFMDGLYFMNLIRLFNKISGLPVQNVPCRTKINGWLLPIFQNNMATETYF